ncbi:vitellogenin-like [Mya arenaria]|uniref:vitellogenin-like n=1 Tax=Mya arenaria TaxID=6604 RepID=UPI0022E2670B|nr:vitellogenin-like [Mya arenaria]
MWHTLFLILALVAGSKAGPIQEIQISDKCARQCTVSHQFNYEPGTTYEFTYETDIRTAVQGASEDHAGVHLTSKVYLDFASKCEMIMRLSDVKLSEHDPETSTMKPVSSPELADLEKQPLTVSFQDGTIEDLCLSQVESDKTLNIKRGILSLIQNNMDDITKPQTLSESDVAGTCETEYSSQDKGWYKQIIKKSKNLLGCTERHNGNSAVQGIPYQAKSLRSNLELL